MVAVLAMLIAYALSCGRGVVAEAKKRGEIRGGGRGEGEGEFSVDSTLLARSLDDESSVPAWKMIEVRASK